MNGRDGTSELLRDQAGQGPRRRSIWLLGAALLAGSPSVALAQSAPAPQDAATAQGAPAPQDASTTDDQSTTLDEIVVTAQRRSESLERTPVTVIAITPDLLLKKVITSDQDLQYAAPGLTVRGNSSANLLTFAIRGQSLDAFSSSRPAVLSYLNEVQALSLSPGPFYDLASIQVLKGPQGTLFGRNVTGGAVLFTSASPTSTFGGNAMVRVGDYSSREYEGALNVPILGDSVLFRVAGDYQYHDGYAYNEYDGTHPGNNKRYGGRGSLLVRFAPNLTNTLVLDYSESRGTNPPTPSWSVNAVGSTNNGIALTSTGALFFGPTLANVLRVPNAFNIYLAAHPKAFPGGLAAFSQFQRARGPYITNVNSPLGHFGRSLVITDIAAYQPSDLVTIKNIFGYNSARSVDFLDFDGSPFLLQGPGPGGLQNRQHFVSDELQVVGKDAAGHLDYVAGFYFSSQRNRSLIDVTAIELLPFSTARTSTNINIARNKTYAGYAQATYRVGDLIGVQGLGVTVGGRYTVDKTSQQALPGSLYYNTSYGQNFEEQTVKKPSYQFGIQEQVNRNLLIYGVTRHSFRSGGFNGSAPPIPVDASGGGNLFRPETTTDYEIGAKFQGLVGSVPVRLNVAGYTQTVKDLQRTNSVFISTILSSASLTLNIPEARVRGIEVDAQITPVKWLDIGGNFAHTDAKFTKNTTVTFTTVTRYGPYGNTPRWQGTAFAQITAPLGDRIGTLSLRSDVFAQTSFYFSNLADTVTPNTKLPGYVLTNFRVALDKIGGSTFSLAGVVRNAFDRTYFIGGLASGNTLGFNSAVAGTPRTFFIEGTFKF